MSKNTLASVAILVTLLIGGSIIFHYRAKAFLKTDQQSTAAPSTPDNGEIQAANSIAIKNNTLSLPVITIKKGSAITWTNTDATDHTITADQLSADAPQSQAFSIGQSYVFTFTKPGSYAYHCKFHDSIKGTVIVTN